MATAEGVMICDVTIVTIYNVRLYCTVRDVPRENSTALES